MKCLCNVIVLSSIISALTFQVQSQPGPQKDVQGKKTVPEKSEPSSPPSEKGKLAKQEEAGKLDAAEVAPPISPASKETMATAVSLALSIGRQADIDDPIDRIKVMLESAKLLAGVSPNDSRYLVAEAADLLLERKKKERHKDEQTKIAGIERDLIALYSK